MAMPRPSTRQGTDNSAQDSAEGGGADDSGTGAQSIGLLERTRSPMRGPDLDPALGRANHRIRGAHQKGAQYLGRSHERNI